MKKAKLILGGVAVLSMCLLAARGFMTNMTIRIDGECMNDSVIWYNPPTNWAERIEAKDHTNAVNDLARAGIICAVLGHNWRDGLAGEDNGMFWYSVRMDRNGDTRAVEIENGCYTHADEWRPYGDDETVSFDMWATDEKHAVKIANERRAMIVASGEWTTDWSQWRTRKQNSSVQGRPRGEGVL